MRKIEKVFTDMVGDADREAQDEYCRVIACFLNTCVRLGWVTCDELQRELLRARDSETVLKDTSV